MGFLERRLRPINWSEGAIDWFFCKIVEFLGRSSNQSIGMGIQSIGLVKIRNMGKVFSSQSMATVCNRLVLVWE